MTVSKPRKKKLKYRNKIEKKIDHYVGQRLRLCRNEKGISQEGLGQILKVSFQQIQKYENGTNRIGAGKLLLISYFLEVPISYFYEGLSCSSFKHNKCSEFKKAKYSKK